MNDIAEPTMARTDAKASLTKTAYFQASPATVWSFLTDKDKLGRWFHPARDHLDAGKSYALVSKDDASSAICWGDVLEADPPHRLVMTFTVKPMAGVMTTVTWTLEENSGGTRLTLVHEGLEQCGDAPLGLIMALDKGWDEHLAGLRAAQ